MDILTSRSRPWAGAALRKSLARVRATLSVSGLLVFLAVTYALVAGLRTVGDPDLGWQLATGRWIVHHQQIPSTDVLSYTAAGKPWMYPALSQVLLYCMHALGGFALLSWVAAFVCAATILILARHNPASAVLAALAVPIIASRTNPRAEMFTEVLFAVFVSILWTFHRTGRARLWLLPPLMLLWTNLHPGFIAGLAVCGAYILLELVDGNRIDAGTRPSERMRRATPFLAATLVATLANPWGPAIYTALYRQAQILKIHRFWIMEWRSVPTTPLRIIREALNWRDSNCVLWWLLAISVMAAVIAAWRRRAAAAGLLAIAAWVALESTRMKGPFASLVVVVAGSVIHDVFKAESFQSVRAWFTARVPRPLVVCAGVFLLVSFVSVRVFDLVTNRYYFHTSYQMSVFGAGESAWLPEEAASFLITHKLPGNIFNDFGIGGFLASKLSPDLHRVYIDGRSIPFSKEQFFRTFQLLGSPLDSSEWQKEADDRNINTIFVSLNRELWGGLANLAGFCQSRGWRLVYLDAYAAVFVRKSPQTAELVARLGKECAGIPFGPPSTGARTRAERFDYYLSSVAVLLSLGRKEEALRQLNSAETIFSDNWYLHYAKGLVLGFSGDLNDAEAELQRSLQIEPSTETAYALGRLLQNEARWAEAERVLQRQAGLCEEPSTLYLELGNIQLATNRPYAALESFAKAEKSTPFRASAQGLGAEFYVRLNTGRAQAWRNVGDLARATQSMKDALAFSPSDPNLRQALAELYTAAGVPSRRETQEPASGKGTSRP